MFLTINVSPQVVVDEAGAIRDLLRDVGRSVVIEITEHVAIEDYGALRAALAELGDHVHLAVDDAGAGYASLRHILELRPTFAKLDISLVRDIDGDELRQAMAAGLNYFALRTGCRLIAEGVETAAEAEMLLRLGIEFGQGYLFGRPARPRGSSHGSSGGSQTT
jgi:EAL domain-containing protein (putative c-di-GMP-specific phosphodiesterase class I)